MISFTNTFLYLIIIMICITIRSKGALCCQFPLHAPLFFFKIPCNTATPTIAVCIAILAVTPLAMHIIANKTSLRVQLHSIKWPHTLISHIDKTAMMFIHITSYDNTKMLIASHILKHRRWSPPPQHLVQY